MGWLRKKAKQLGKGIKKIMGKIGKAFGKLGIVGQLGLMMFLPGLAGSLWGKLGSFAAKGTSFIHKAAGAIYNAGTAIGKAYSTVTEAIGNGLDRAFNFMKGEGFVLSPDRASIFTSTDKAVDLTTKVSDSLGGKVVNTVPGGETTVVGKKVAEESSKSLLSKVPDKIGEAVEGVKEAFKDPQKLVKEGVESGVKSGIGSRLSYSIAGDPPVQRILATNFDVNSVGHYDSTGTFNTEDFTQGNLAYQALGSSWGGPASLAAPFLTEEIFSGGEIDYAKRAAQLRYTT